MKTESFSSLNLFVFLSFYFACNGKIRQRKEVIISLLLYRKQFSLSNDGASGLPVSVNVNVTGVRKSGDAPI